MKMSPLPMFVMAFFAALLLSGCIVPYYGDEGGYDRGHDPDYHGGYRHRDEGRGDGYRDEEHRGEGSHEGHHEGEHRDDGDHH